MLRWKHDVDTDALYVRRSNEPIVESEQIKPGIVLDYDSAGNVVGLEILNTARQDDSPPKRTA